MTKSGGIRVSLAALALSLTGYIVLVLVARSLTPEDNAQFLLFWALLFGCYGVLNGIAQESTRTTTEFYQNNADNITGTIAEDSHAHAVKEPFAATRKKPLLILNGLFFSLILAAIIAAITPLWLSYFNLSPATLTALLISIICFGCHSALLGTAAGRAEWKVYSLLLAGEGITRLLATIIVTFFMAQLTSFEISSALGSLFWLALFLFSPRTRKALKQRANISGKTLRRNTMHATISSSSTALLVLGFPLLLRLSSSEEAYTQSAALLLAVSVTRAPLLLPLAAFQNFLVTYFMKNPSSRSTTSPPPTRILLSRLTKPLAGLLIIGSLASILAWFLGPFVMLVFGPHYSVSPWVMAALTFAGTVIAMLTITGTAILAANKHSYVSAGWAIASIASVTLLFWLDGTSTESRVAISLIVGPLVGCLVHLTALVRAAHKKRLPQKPNQHQR